MPNPNIVLVPAEPQSLLVRPLTLLGRTATAAVWATAQLSREALTLEDLRPPPPSRQLLFVHHDGTLQADPRPSSIFSSSHRYPSEIWDYPLSPVSPFPDHLLWSDAAVERYVAGQRPQPALVFQRLLAVLQHFIDFSGSLAATPTLTAECLAAYLLSTWFAPAFPSLPPLWITGPSGSGKSRLLRLLAGLAHLGLLFTTLPPDTALRHFAALGASLALDDAHFLSARFGAGAGFAFGSSARHALFVASLQRGALQPVSLPVAGGARGARRFRLLDVSGPRLFASPHPPHLALAPHCLVIHLLPTTRPALAALDPSDPAAWPSGLSPRQLIDDLWALALSCLPQLTGHLVLAAQAAASSDFPLPGASRSGFPPSAWHPLLAVASWLATPGPAPTRKSAPAASAPVPGLLPRLLGLARDDHTQRLALQPPDLATLALQAVLDCLAAPLTLAPAGAPDGNDGTLQSGRPRPDAPDGNDGTLQSDRPQPDAPDGNDATLQSDRPQPDAPDGNDGTLQSDRLPASLEFTSALVLAAMQRLVARQDFDLPAGSVTPALVGRLLAHLRFTPHRTETRRAWVITPAALLHLAQAYQLPLPSSLQPPLPH